MPLTPGDSDSNIIWAEVKGFRFTTGNQLNHDGVMQACMSATSGDVIYWSEASISNPTPTREPS